MQVSLSEWMVEQILIHYTMEKYSTVKRNCSLVNSFTVNVLYVFILKWVVLQSKNLCVLMGKHLLLTFRFITDKWGYIYHLVLFIIFVLYVLWSSFLLCLHSFKFLKYFVKLHCMSFGFLAITHLSVLVVSLELIVYAFDLSHYLQVRSHHVTYK